MVEKVRIQNFKSIVDLSMDLGRINVIIGANGCGKTNILEAITFASAASQQKLDNEFLGTRIRTTSAPYMFAAFEDIEPGEEIQITTLIDDFSWEYRIKNQAGKWEQLGFTSAKVDELLGINQIINNLTFDNETEKTLVLGSIQNAKMFSNLAPILNNFLAYAPEESKLRLFSDESYILPFGRRGEGLFQHLKQLAEKKDEGTIKAINEGLYMLDWFGGFRIPDDLLTNEYKLSIGDRYLNASLRNFDQRSTNEGFLYLLFYLTLFNSKETPGFFAVDNIETSLNPKLCTKLMEYLIDAAKRNSKQAIFTTHNPYVLDGLDLSDDEQRLFVARRDVDGHTQISRVPYKKERTNKLSDVWMKGLIGGLPDNF